MYATKEDIVALERHAQEYKQAQLRKGLESLRRRLELEKTSRVNRLIEELYAKLESKQ
jgi:tRNA 2-selenouridine synthase SelU